MRIGAGAQVTLHFALRLADGQVIDATHARGPATFVVGDGSLPPGFEHALMGLEAGAEQRFELAPEQAFGPSREENVKLLPAARFDAIELDVGVVVSFSGPDGALPGVIKSLQGDLVVVDFNHPLAGKSLIFEVSIIAVEPTDDDFTGS